MKNNFESDDKTEGIKIDKNDDERTTMSKATKKTKKTETSEATKTRQATKMSKATKKYIFAAFDVIIFSLF